MSIDDPTPIDSAKHPEIKQKYDTMLEAVKETAAEVTARIKALTDEFDIIQPDSKPAVPPDTDAATPTTPPASEIP